MERKIASLDGWHRSVPQNVNAISAVNIFGSAATMPFYLFQENFSTGIICESLDYLAQFHKNIPFHSKQLTFFYAYGIIMAKKR